MQKTRNRFLLFLMLIAGQASAQKKELITNYINTYKDIAIAEMQRTGVPAAITLAQGIHESGAGNSELVLQSNNHFGIKCKSNWTGETVRHDDDAKGECFRKYPLAADSYRDHSDFLKNGQRYSFLFALDPTDYKGWARGLKQAGYATNPKYPEVLIKLIEDYQLQDYTLLALQQAPMPASDTNVIPASFPSNDGGSISQTTEDQKNIYPTGVFKRNETKVVFAKRGTSYLSIAQQYSVDLARIFEFNEIEPAETTPADGLVYIQRKRRTGLNNTHVVAKGETLHDIAQAEAIRMDALAELNWIKITDQPAIGETLSLQNKSTTVPRLALPVGYSLKPFLPVKHH